MSPYHNNTDKNWISVKDSTWTEIISPLGKKLSRDKGRVANCRPGTHLGLNPSWTNFLNA